MNDDVLTVHVFVIISWSFLFSILAIACWSIPISHPPSIKYHWTINHTSFVHLTLSKVSTINNHKPTITTINHHYIITTINKSQLPTTNNKLTTWNLVGYQLVIFTHSKTDPWTAAPQGPGFSIGALAWYDCCEVAWTRRCSQWIAVNGCWSYPLRCSSYRSQQPCQRKNGSVYCGTSWRSVPAVEDHAQPRLKPAINSFQLQLNFRS